MGFLSIDFAEVEDVLRPEWDEIFRNVEAGQRVSCWAGVFSRNVEHQQGVKS